MANRNPFLFVSYAREDYPAVAEFTAALRVHGVETWMDVESLKPGEVWEKSIRGALEQAAGLLVFVSRNSMASAWVRREIEIMIERAEITVVPVILEEVADLPRALAERQWLMLTERTPERVAEAAALLARHLRAAPAPPTRLSKPRRDAVTKWMLEKARGLARPTERALEPPEPESAGLEGLVTVSPRQPQSIFVVHGHDETLLKDVLGYLGDLRLSPVVLKRIGGAQQSLFQKFMNWAGDTCFAIVLLSGDDFGAARQQYEAPGVGERCLQYRARQNVVFELGYFYGRLGWENVFVVYKPPPKVFPNFEPPSDLLGIVWDEVDESGAWRRSLAERLANSGFALAEAAAGPM